MGAKVLSFEQADERGPPRLCSGPEASRSAHSTAASDSGEASTPTTRHVWSFDPPELPTVDHELILVPGGGTSLSARPGGGRRGTARGSPCGCARGCPIRVPPIARTGSGSWRSRRQAPGSRRWRGEAGEQLARPVVLDDHHVDRSLHRPERELRLSGGEGGNGREQGAFLFQQMRFEIGTQLGDEVPDVGELRMALTVRRCDLGGERIQQRKLFPRGTDGGWRRCARQAPAGRGGPRGVVADVRVLSSAVRSRVDAGIGARIAERPAAGQQ